MADPRQVHLIAAKHILRYLKGTIDYGLRYAADCKFGLVGYTDSDWVGSVTNQKNTSGCCFSLGTTVIAWRSQKQTRIVFITTQGEYVRDRMEKGAMEVLVQIANILTKPLSRVKLEYFRDKLGVVPCKRE